MVGDGPDLKSTTIALPTGSNSERVLRSGDIIGGTYRLKNLIGKGAMGLVFRAEHTAMNQDYALKMLAPDQISEVTWNRFQAEGKAIARLDHPNIVKIYNMGIDRGDCPYYVMDLLDGVPLSDCINEKMPLTVDEILHIFTELASGFGYAHSRGIVHRDVKPSNIVLIDSGGQYPTAKIVDFGIAKDTGKKDLHNQSLTATGEIFGSPFYMSPEQCLGTEIDNRSDIYSLGCTLFETLAGRPPFVGESALQTVLMHQNKATPSLESVSAKFSSEEMDTVIAKMMAKRPADRYQSMEQIAHDLNRIRERKAVGKNIETGFRSSVDSELENYAERYETEAEKAKRKKVFIALALLLVAGTTVVAVFYKTMPWVVEKPKTGPAVMKEIQGWHTTKETQDGLKDFDKQFVISKKELDSMAPITSTVDEAKGERIFHCPSRRIGSLAWYTDKVNPRAPSEEYTEIMVPAKGEVRTPAKRTITFIVDESDDRATWLNPVIISKFGPDEITSFRLEARSTLDAYSSADDPDAEAHQVTALVKAASGWTKLRTMDFYNVTVADPSLAELDKHKTLQRFNIRNGAVSGAALAQQKFLKDLVYLAVAVPTECDPVLKALKGSPNLTNLLLENVTISASGLQALASCPNLSKLALTYVLIDKDGLDAIANIKGLTHARLWKNDLQPDQISHLAKLAFIKSLSLELAKKWTAAERISLMRQLPHATLLGTTPQPNYRQMEGP